MRHASSLASKANSDRIMAQFLRLTSEADDEEVQLEPQEDEDFVSSLTQFAEAYGNSLLSQTPTYEIN
jgi:hypothetical protein